MFHTRQGIFACNFCKLIFFVQRLSNCIIIIKYQLHLHSIWFVLFPFQNKLRQYCIELALAYNSYAFCIWSIRFAGILLSSQSPPVSTPLEPCRVAPYVNLPSLRGTSVATPSTPQHFPSSAAAAAAAFSAFDPALLSAAHQVYFLIFW